MNSIKEILGCGCRAQAFFGPKSKSDGGTPAHTFPWAKTQYPEERQVWPTHQSLELSLNIDKEELSGSNTLQFKALVPNVESFKIDAVDLRIHDVQINKKSARFSVGETETTVYLEKPMARGEVGEVRITYTCIKPKAGIYFIKPDSKYPDRPTQVWTQGQDDDARYWFPCFDEPRIKCSFEMKVEVPAGFVATSNGALHSESRGGKTWTFLWKSSALIPSYLVTLTAGKFSEIKEDWRGKPVVYLCEKGREAEAKLSFGKTPQMLELFSKKIGIDYPYEKYTQIAASEFVFGGMENTSATTQTDVTLHPYEIEEDFSSDDLVAHELAHQWFGDLVTCKTWSHGWLNEGWATFMEQVFKEEDLGKDETDYFRFEELQIYLNEDKGLYRRPVVTQFYSDPGEVWDRHIYQKGGLILNMLRQELGEEDFWKGTRDYLNEHKGGVVETVDFQRAHEKASGRDLQLFFDQWIFKGGYPDLKAGFEWDDKSKLAKFKLTQKQELSDLTPLFNFKSEVEFFFKDDPSVKFPVLMNEKEQTYYIPLKEKPTYCRFDFGNKIIKTMEWALPTEMIKEQLSKDTDVVGKIWAMKHLAKEASKEGVEILIDRLKTDTFWGVRAEAAHCLGETQTAVALQALINALSEEKRSKVRTRICTALGHFHEEGAAEALIHTLDKDKSIFTRGAAAHALGKTKSVHAFDKLKKAITIKSWNDHIRGQAFVGLRHLRDPRALDLFLDGAKYGSPKGGRIAAVSALGDYGLDQKEITEQLEETLKDPYVRLRFFAADALARRKDPSALGSIEESAYRVVDGHFKTAAFRAARRLRDNLRKPEELASFKESLEKLQDENRKLKDRLQKLEDTPAPKTP